jgi:PEP-CTERM motif
MKIRKLATFAATVAALGISVPAAADTFQGTIWSLTYSGSPLADADPLHETYRVTLSVDTNGYTGAGAGGLYLDQVALKVSSQLFAASLFSAPGGASDWQLAGGGLNSGGCSGSGSGFECANSLSVLNGGKGVAINPGNGVGIDYSWVFDLTMNNGALITSLLGDSIKARFVNSSGAKVGDLISENMTLATPTTPVPEPESYAMLLAGLGLLRFAAHRRKMRAISAA